MTIFLIVSEKKKMGGFFDFYNLNKIIYIMKFFLLIPLYHLYIKLNYTVLTMGKIKKKIHILEKLISKKYFHKSNHFKSQNFGFYL